MTQQEDISPEVIRVTESEDAPAGAEPRGAHRDTYHKTSSINQQFRENTLLLKWPNSSGKESRLFLEMFALGFEC